MVRRASECCGSWAEGKGVSRIFCFGQSDEHPDDPRNKRGRFSPRPSTRSLVCFSSVTSLPTRSFLILCQSRRECPAFRRVSDKKNPFIKGSIAWIRASRRHARGRILFLEESEPSLMAERNFPEFSLYRFISLSKVTC